MTGEGLHKIQVAARRWRTRPDDDQGEADSVEVTLLVSTDPMADLVFVELPDAEDEWISFNEPAFQRAIKRSSEWFYEQRETEGDDE